jgi:rhodanese-related sulfurtransferase
MPRELNRYQVREMLAEGAQLVEVLPEEDFHPWHLPGAVNIPLKEFNEKTLRQLDPARPVIVYCANNQ